ncbi:MAG: hypothetical protein LBQ69_03940 [Treponema sp.]|jgi:hypothetical protein|nr:hypothetical protein [Treponema sp.]
MGKKRLALHWVTILAVTLFAFLAIGSATQPKTPLVFDESVPEEESATILFWPGVEVTSYNGIPVPTKKDPLMTLGMKSEWRYVRLPAGKMEFVIDAAWVGVYTKVISRNTTLTYTFEPGEHYSIKFGTIEDGLITDETRWGFQVYHGEDYDGIPVSDPEGRGMILQ